MKALKTADLVNMISQLGTEGTYEYFSEKAKLRITDITKPEGPIKFRRWNIRDKESRGSISTNQLNTIAVAFSKRPDYPIQLDRLFSGGGNSRSALETLLAYTPNFFICYPQKSNPYTGTIERRIKHIMWCPDSEHRLGQVSEKEFQQVISEVELDADFGNIEITPDMLTRELDSIEAKRVHTQMQVALVRIGGALNFHTWVAKNDRAIAVGDTTLGNLPGVIPSLDNVKILFESESKQIASRIDCIWFSNDYRYIPAVIEVEHTTGVTSGLTRMLQFREIVPALQVNCAIAAPNELRNKVVSEANSALFRNLDVKYLPYSTVRVLYGLIRNYNLSNVVHRTFIEPFMEKVVE
jgi:type II restriction enzyme